MIQTDGISAPVSGAGWSFSLTYYNRPIDPGSEVKEDAGYNWITNIPHIEERPGNTLLLRIGAYSVAQFTFQQQEMIWRGKNGVYAWCEYDSGMYIVHGTRGGKVAFYALGDLKGKVSYIVDNKSNTWTFTYWTSGHGQLSYKLKTIYMSPSGYFWEFYYSSLNGFLSSINLKQGATLLSHMIFNYYTSNEEGKGSIGDLCYLYVKARNASGWFYRKTHFRYYTEGEDDGRKHDLKYVIGPDNFEVIADKNSTFLLADLDESAFDDETSGKYLFDYHFKYLKSLSDSLDGRVWEETVRNGGCGCSGGSTLVGTYNYSYKVKSRSADNFNIPYVCVKQANPDGTFVYVDVNRIGNALVKVIVDSNEQKLKALYNLYDSDGLLIASYNASACDAGEYSWGTSQPEDVKKTDEGLVEMFTYKKWTGDDQKYSGQLLTRKEKNLSTGDIRTLIEYEYPADPSHYPYPTCKKVYPAEGGNPITTSYAYSWNSGANYDFLITRITTFPAITQPAAQASATRQENYYSSGQNAGKLESVVDENGITTEYTYYNGTGLLKDKIIDTAEQGLKIKEETVYDIWGNKFRHTTYNSQDNPVQVRRWVYTTLGNDGYPNYIGYADGYVPLTVTLSYDHFYVSDNPPRDGIVHITVSTLGGKVLETANGFVDFDDNNLNDDFNDDAETLEGAFLDPQKPNKKLFNRVTNVYDEIEYQDPDLTYTSTGTVVKRKERWTDANDGQSPKYITYYGYDSMGRLCEKTDAEGTITKYVHDVLGRQVEVKLGTSEANLKIVQSSEYDWGSLQNGDDLLTKTIYYIDSDNPTDVDNRITRIGYDEWERQVWFANLTGTVSGDPWNVMEYVYDNLDHQTEIKSYWGTAPAGSTWKDMTWNVYGEGTAAPAHFWQKITTNSFDERGRNYQTIQQLVPVYSNGPGTGGDEYVSKRWYSKRNEIIKSQPPGKNFKKLKYDAAGRLTAIYTGYDWDETDSFTEAGDVSAQSGDVILTEVDYEYDNAGRQILKTMYERNPEEDSGWTNHYGALSENLLSNSRRSYFATWYFPAGREKAEVDYGDNGGNVLTRPSSPPSTGSDTVLLTQYEYGCGYSQDPLYSGQARNTGWVKTTDSYGLITYSFSDNIGRNIRVIRNYSQGGAPGFYLDDSIPRQRNVTSEFVFDGLDRKVKAIAYEMNYGASVEKQLTKYEYGVSTSDDPGASLIDSNNLLRKILHGKDSGGETFNREILFAYNKLGDVIWKAAGDCGSPQNLRSTHEYAYDLLGRPTLDSVTQAAGDVDTSIMKIGSFYDSLNRRWKVRTLTGTDAEVNSVAWDYDADGHVTKSTQDHGFFWSKSINYSWSAEGGSNDYPVKRLTEIYYPEVYGKQRRTVTYIRSGQTLNPDWSGKDWVTGRISAISDSRQGETPTGHASYSEYMGLSRVMKMGLGYLVEERYCNTANPPELSLDRFGRVTRLYAKKVLGGTVIADYRYNYNRYHSPVSRNDFGPLSKDEAYGYDDLQRLVKFDPKGDNNTKTWDLTSVGNWKEVKLNSTSVDTRGHNERNEIDSRTVGGAVPVYDTVGNTTGLPKDVGTGSFTCVYDAWNRLVEVKAGSTTLAHYERDGLGRIIENIEAGLHYYYSTQWQLLSVFKTNSTSDLIVKDYIWGARYIDENLSTITYDLNGNNPVRRYHLQDLNWNVVATTDTNGTPVEFVTYDPYGLPAFYTGSGTLTSFLTSNVAADFLYQGRWLELYQSGNDNVRVYHFRNRAYGPKMGRFLQTDPIGIWGDGVNLGNGYGFVGGRVVDMLDFLGLIVTACDECDKNDNPKQRESKCQCHIYFRLCIKFLGDNDRETLQLYRTAMSAKIKAMNACKNWKYAVERYNKNRSCKIFVDCKVQVSRKQYGKNRPKNHKIFFGDCLGQNKEKITCNGSDKTLFWNTTTIVPARRVRRAHVVNGSQGTWHPGTSHNVVRHEFGHMFGLPDDYIEIKNRFGRLIRTDWARRIKGRTKSNWRGGVMGSARGGTIGYPEVNAIIRKHCPKAKIK